MTVGDVRKVIDGLEDGAEVRILFSEPVGQDGMHMVELSSVDSDSDGLMVFVDVTCSGEGLDLDDLGDDDE